MNPTTNQSANAFIFVSHLQNPLNLRDSIKNRKPKITQ